MTPSGQISTLYVNVVWGRANVSIALMIVRVEDEREIVLRVVAR